MKTASSELKTTPTSASAENDKKPAYSWCSCASIKPNGETAIERIAGYFDEQNKKISDLPFQQVIPNRVLDLSISADWMEYLEYIEGRINDVGGAGAYDTMRCDVLVSATKPKTIEPVSERVWGLSFHLQRLQRSYFSLLQAQCENDDDDKDMTVTSPSGYDTDGDDDNIPILHNNPKFAKAVEESTTLIQCLLDEAEQSMAQMPYCNVSPSDFDEMKPENETKATLIRLFRLTVLWSLPLSSSVEQDDKIVVRAHASSSCEPIKVHPSPKPIVVTIAAHASTQNNTKPSMSIDESLPTRFNNPQFKIAAWCRLRREMECPDTYKPPGVSEVLMVRKGQDDQLEVLEGVSSNVFVVYNDGTLRTATDGVLYGYVRQLVLETATECGLTVDSRPVRLDERERWQEVFITSSSRLLFPVSKILVPSTTAETNENRRLDQVLFDSNEGVSLTEFWKDPVLLGETVPKSGIPKWQELLKAILRKGGYQ